MDTWREMLLTMSTVSRRMLRSGTRNTRVSRSPFVMALRINPVGKAMICASFNPKASHIRRAVSSAR